MTPSICRAALPASTISQLLNKSRLGTCKATGGPKSLDQSVRGRAAAARRDHCVTLLRGQIPGIVAAGPEQSDGTLELRPRKSLATDGFGSPKTFQKVMVKLAGMFDWV